MLLYLLLPSLLVIPVSFTDTDYLALPEHGLSLQHWQNTFTDPKWMSGLGQSLFIGFCAMLVATVTGTLCAVGCWKLSSRLGEAIRVLTLVPMIVPTIVYALGLYRTYTQVENLTHVGMLDTYLGVILAHAVIGMPFVVITVGAALSNMDRRLEQAARSLGASATQTLWRVILPNVRPGILSGAVFAFITSWDELVIVLFIASRKVQTLPRAIWSGIRESLDPSIAVIAVLLITVTFIALVPTLLSRRNANSSH
ncbi:ABC transporter permease [Polaromonas sp. P2-4]|nr:ABC transporter permease [Polaromonas sp. P2-4]